jgi:hypothetical protein
VDGSSVSSLLAFVILLLLLLVLPLLECDALAIGVGEVFDNAA